MRQAVRTRPVSRLAAHVYGGTKTTNTGIVTTFFVSGENTAKERDSETGLYNFGARMFDPRTSRWLSVDPAMYQMDFIPVAPNSDTARRHNENLPNGGVFFTLNLHVFNYSNNNPLKYKDPDGRFPIDFIKPSFLNNGGGGAGIQGNNIEMNCINSLTGITDNIMLSRIANWYDNLSEENQNRLTGVGITMFGASMITGSAIEMKGGKISRGTADGFIAGIQITGIGIVQAITGISVFGSVGELVRTIFAPPESSIFCSATGKRFDIF